MNYDQIGFTFTRPPPPLGFCYCGCGRQTAQGARGRHKKYAADGCRIKRYMLVNGGADRICIGCGAQKPIKEFRKHASGYLSPTCKKCRLARDNWARNNRNKAQQASRRAQLDKYGLTIEQYEEMLKSQNGVCAICKKPEIGKPLRVDHDHKTETVRGLLCTSCNVGIGNMKDNIELLEAAIEYLKQHA